MHHFNQHDPGLLFNQGPTTITIQLTKSNFPVLFYYVGSKKNLEKKKIRSMIVCFDRVYFERLFYLLCENAIVILKIFTIFQGLMNK